MPDEDPGSDFPGTPPGPDILRKKAEKAYRGSQYSEALALFDELLAQNPNDHDALNGKGQTLLKLGRQSEARQFFTLAHQTLEAPAGGTARKCSPSGSPPPPAVSLYSPRRYQKQEEKNPLVAALCSVVIPGLGQVYNGELIKGIVILVLTLAGLVFLIIPGLMVWLFGAFSAYSTAGKINAGKSPYRPTSYIEMLLFGIIAVILMFFIIMIALYLISVLLSGIAENWFPNPFEARGIPV